ncbi:MAG: glycosyl transferase family 8 [Desulfovibrio sp.]|nr:glycosyl transferase family 8 [Desulfovibrio sp.]
MHETLKKPLALLIGVTGDLGFAAGCLLQSLRRHSPHLEADVFLYTDGALPPADAALLEGMGALITPFTPPQADLPAEVVRQFSQLCLVCFEGFLLLDRYNTVIRLDADTAVQDDVSALANFGPLSMALEDPYFTESGRSLPASVNVLAPLPDLDGEAPNLNSGVLVLQDSLPEPAKLRDLCLRRLKKDAPYLRYPDQAVLNMLAQQLRRTDPHLFSLLPYERFNAHPRNPAAHTAAVVHAFGAYKLWDDGLTRCCFPEWHRDYCRWLSLGGSPWRGEVGNGEYLEAGAFSMLNRLHGNVQTAQELLDRMRLDLVREKKLKRNLEKMIAGTGSRSPVGKNLQ